MQAPQRSKQFEVNEAVHARLERRLQFGLGRLSPRIQRVTVRLVDLNGPRGGRDKSCRIEVRLLPAGRVFVEERDANLYAAVVRATDRVARSVSRAAARTDGTGGDARRRQRRGRRPLPQFLTIDPRRGAVPWSQDEEHHMKCPVCTETHLVMSERRRIAIDYCPKCRGVWLDRGELEKLIERSQPAQTVARRFSPPPNAHLGHGEPNAHDHPGERGQHGCGRE